MNRPLILTYDVGTQSTRAILVDKQGNIVDKEQVKYAEPYFRQRPGWAEQKTDFYFDNNLIRKTIHCVIEASDVKNRWIGFIRFYEHNVREISDLCVADYIEYYCPAVNNILKHLKIHYQTESYEDWEDMINGLFGVEATVNGVCKKHNISIL